MANDFGALVDSTLIHDVMDDFRLDLGPFLGLALNVGEMNSDGGMVREMRPGSTLTITNYFGEVAPYNASAGYVAQDYAVGDPVTITCPSDPWARSVVLTPAEYRLLVGGPRKGAAYDSLRRKINIEMMYSMKKKMVQDLLALVTAGNFDLAPTVSAPGTFTRSSEIDLDTTLFGRNLMDRGNASVVLNPTAYGEWAKDHVALNTNTGASQSARLVGGGQKSQVTDFTFYRTNVPLPAAADRGIAFTRTAIGVINRIPDEPGLDGKQTGSDAFNSLATVVTQEGFAFLFRTWKNWGTGNLQLDIASIWKFAPLQKEALQRIVAA